MSKKKRGRFGIKAQASIFMLVALAIMLAGIAYFFYQRISSEEEIKVDPKIAPIKSFVDSCIKKVADDGLETIGLTGGYINIPEKVKNNPRSYLSNHPGFKIPYWWYDGIDAIPTEEFIKLQLREHIKNELSICLDNFKSFEERYKVKALNPLIVDVQFNDNDVSIDLRYPLEITSSDRSLNNIERFRYVIPIRFKKVYELAKRIMESENNDYFLERKTIDLISMASDIPTTDIEVSCNTKIWRLNDIKEKLKTLLRVNLPYIRIKGTNYNENLYVPNPSGRDIYSQTYYQQHYIWEIDENSEKKYNGMKVSFQYENWPLNIFARPSNNGILKSNSQKGTDMLSFFCLHIWHFTYDINYPVLVSIIEQHKNGKYLFNFAFKVNIDHNQPSKVNRGTTIFETAPDLSSEEYCNTPQNEITIFTVNNATGDDIRDVNLTFVCGRFYCDMGQSNWLSFGAAAGITKRFPYCVNGVIKGAKDGFEESKSFIQTDVDGRSYILLLNPIKEFKNFKIVKHQLSNPSIAKQLKPNEKASILLKGKDIGYEGFSVYPTDDKFSLKLPDKKDMTLEVNIYVVDEESIIGGYIGEWSIKKGDFANADEIIFHVIEQGPATDDERFLFISGLSSYSKNVPSPEIR